MKDSPKEEGEEAVFVVIGAAEAGEAIGAAIGEVVDFGAGIVVGEGAVAGETFEEIGEGEEGEGGEEIGEAIGEGEEVVIEGSSEVDSEEMVNSGRIPEMTSPAHLVGLRGKCSKMGRIISRRRINRINKIRIKRISRSKLASDEMFSMTRRWRKLSTRGSREAEVEE